MYPLIIKKAVLQEARLLQMIAFKNIVPTYTLQENNSMRFQYLSFAILKKTEVKQIV